MTEYSVICENHTNSVLQQAGVEFNEILIPDEALENGLHASDIIESALNNAQPDLLVVGASILKFSFLTDASSQTHSFRLTILPCQNSFDIPREYFYSR